MPRPSNSRVPWTVGRCAAAHRYDRESAEIFAATDRRLNRSGVIAFRCPFGDHHHVSAPPAACVACGGAGQNSKGTSECGPCKGTGVRTK